MVKILTFLVIVLSTLLSRIVLTEVVTEKKTEKEKDKKELKQFIYSNSIHYPYFDFKKKKLDDE